jgi:glycosyltransferase involved in cell wall biosynthesis
LYEGFGLPVLDAMARGVPTIVSTSSSLPEVAGEAAVPVDPRSVAAIAEALERVTTDPSLAARLGEAGRARAARFTWEETARRTLEVYKTIL